MMEVNLNEETYGRTIWDLLRRRPREEILKKNLKREAFEDLYTDVLFAEAQVLSIIPYAHFGVHSSAKKWEYDRFKTPISCVLGVGGLASKNIGHVGDYKTLKRGFKTMTEDSLRDLLFRATIGYDDFDGFLITSNKPKNEMLITADAFKKSLPTMPENIRRYFDYEFHDDCVKSKKEFQNLLDSTKGNGYIPMLKKHELEILDRNPNKKVIPIVLYLKQDPDFEPVIEELMDKKCVRNIEDYTNSTFLPWAREYKDTFPQRSQQIIENVFNKIKNNGLGAEDTESCMKVYNRI